MLHIRTMGAYQDETPPDTEKRYNTRTCKQQLTPSAKLEKYCENRGVNNS